MNTKALLIGAAVVVALIYLARRSGAAAPAGSVVPLAYRGLTTGASSAGDAGAAATPSAWLYSLIHPAYDPTSVIPDANTLNTGNSTIATSPVTPSPAVLPWSYKQAVVDTPALLGTDALFTPAVVGGSSGAWSESGVPGNAAGPSAPYYSGESTTALASGQYPSLMLQ